MADNIDSSNPTNQPLTPDETGTRQSQFHYYSGGEVKELEHTRISPVLYWTWGIVALGAVLYFLLGGALGPTFGGFKPTGNTVENQQALRAQLDNGSAVQLTSLNLESVPRPAGQTRDEAVAAGTQVYQTYCIGCHGPNQDGNGVNSMSLNPKPRNLRDAPFMQAMSYERIWTSLHKGVYGTAMPRWENTLTPKEFQDVIVYVFSLTAPTATSAIGNAKAGGTNQYNNGIQNIPNPITPPINGNPAAPTSTAPPSTDSAASPMAGGRSASPPLTLTPAAPTPGSDTPPGSGSSSAPAGAGTAPGAGTGGAAGGGGTM